MTEPLTDTEAAEVQRVLGATMATIAEHGEGLAPITVEAVLRVMNDLMENEYADNADACVGMFGLLMAVLADTQADNDRFMGTIRGLWGTD